MGNASQCGGISAGYEAVAMNYFVPISFISVLLCLATIVLVCKQKLHKTLVYRLATYQVLSAMEFSILWIIAGTLTISELENDNTRIVLNALLMHGFIVYEADVHRLDIVTSICSGRVP